MRSNTLFDKSVLGSSYNIDEGGDVPSLYLPQLVGAEWLLRVLCVRGHHAPVSGQDLRPGRRRAYSSATLSGGGL